MKNKTMGQLAKEFELNAPKYLKPYIEQGKCNCRVCLCIKYLKDKAPQGACEIWAEEGFELASNFHSKKISKKEYDKHFNKKTLDGYIQHSNQK